MNRADIQKALQARSTAARLRHTITEITDEKGAPMVAYFRPMNTTDLIRFSDRLSAGDMSAFAEIFIAKAEDKDGGRIFDDGDHVWLLELLEPAETMGLLKYVSPNLRVDDASTAPPANASLNGDGSPADAIPRHGRDDFEQTVGNFGGTDG